MQVTIGAKCWDGVRSKTIANDTVNIYESPVAISSERFIDKVKRGVMRLNDPKVKGVISFAVPLLLLAHGLPPIGITHAFAQGASVPAMAAVDSAVPVMSEAVKTKILHAFDPLIGMIQSLSYPIAGVMIAGGCLFIMVGNRERGMDMLKNAAIGYILVQLAPVLLDLLVGIGGSV